MEKQEGEVGRRSRREQKVRKEGAKNRSEMQNGVVGGRRRREDQ